MSKIELAMEIEELKCRLDEVAAEIDFMNEAQVTDILRDYKKIHVILRAQLSTLKEEPKLRLV